MLTFALQQVPQNPAGGIFALFASVWCCAISVGIGHFVIFIVAIVQILSRSMPTDAKILWCAVCWFLPIIGPILWWTIGSKQNPHTPSARPIPAPLAPALHSAP